MHAVIQTGGKQYRVSEGDLLRVEKIESNEGDKVEFDNVLMVSDGDKVQVGTPYVSGAKVTATVQEQGRGKKVMIIKFKRRKKYRRTQGHRQSFTELKIDSIAG